QTGLFSAVVTAFVVQSLQVLSPNYAQITASISLVEELVRMQRAIAEGSPVSDVTRSQLRYDSVTHAGTDVWVNGLWLTSLCLALFTSLLSVLAKQCIQHFSSLPLGTHQDHAHVRAERLWALKAWKVPSIIGILPTLLIVALLLFFAGLAVSTVTVNKAISIVVFVLAGAAFYAYHTTISVPLIDSTCAYRAPDHVYTGIIAVGAVFARIYIQVLMLTPFLL
ncbi:hypothetical protein K523DRAFT_237433, partial [Schizophyllum commune Tattone D]